MATLTITSRGQVTLKKDLLQHMGITPGEKIEISLSCLCEMVWV
jgi:bifunctional DNA-binding transcriptional regulator/antitoxin component of YhaV-PrlF toxin-antitoxin module